MPQSQTFDKCFFNISPDFIGLIAGEGFAPGFSSKQRIERGGAVQTEMEITVRKGRIPLKDRRLLTAALLLPLTVLLLFAALADGAASAGAAGAQPQVQDIAFERAHGKG